MPKFAVTMEDGSVVQVDAPRESEARTLAIGNRDCKRPQSITVKAVAEEVAQAAPAAAKK